MLKTRTLRFLLVPAAFLALSCELLGDAAVLTGYYESIVFTEPGQHDGGVDIQAKGGFIQLRLRSDSAVEGHLFVPANIGSNYGNIDQRFTGSYTLVGDRVRVRGTGTLVDMQWLVKDDSLESPEFAGHLASFKIVLAKRP